MYHCAYDYVFFEYNTTDAYAFMVVNLLLYVV